MKIREVIQLLLYNGWTEERSKGSARHFWHARQRGLITLAGNEEKELAPGSLSAVLKAGLR